MKDIIISSIMIPVVTSILASIITFILSNHVLQKDKTREQRKKYFVLLDLICHHLVRISKVTETLETPEKKKKFKEWFRVKEIGALHKEITIPTFACIGKNLQSLVELQVKKDSKITDSVKYIYKYMDDIPYKETLKVLHGNSYVTKENEYYDFDEFLKAVDFVLEENRKFYIRK